MAVKRYNGSSWDTVAGAGTPGAAGIVTSATAPSDTSVLWADTTVTTNNALIPAGGTTGQVLSKTSSSDYAASWSTPSGGLTLITAQTFTAASTVSLNNIFSSTYDNYRVIIDWLGVGGNAALSFRFRASGADNTTSNYYLVRSGATTGGTAENQGNAAAAQINYLAYGNDTPLSTITMDVLKPFLSKKTTINGVSVGLNTGYSLVAGHTLNCLFDASTSFDGFSIYPSASTITGVVRIYGYAN
jgi:hypothetical protein